MDDNVSIQSSDSMTTSGEYEIVPEGSIEMDSVSKSPTLNIANNGDMLDLKNDLKEVIQELDGQKGQQAKSQSTRKLSIPSTSATLQSIELSPSFDVPDCTNLGITPSPTVVSASITTPIASQPSNVATSDVTKVGQSIFYDCMDMSPVGTEKQDDMKPEKSDTDEELSDIDQGCTIFSGVTYLGAANMKSPKCSVEIQRNMCELNSGSASAGLKVSVSIPNNSDGCVILYDAGTNSVVQSYEIHRIVYYERGNVGSKQEACFAFTWSHGDSAELRVHQCHVFRCNIPEAVNQVNSCFAKAFHCYPLSLTGSVTSAIGDNNSIMLASITSDMSGNPLNSAGYEFIVSLEIREKVAKSSYSPVPRDRSCFKLRCNTDKEVSITVKQSPSTILQPLYIERCFGVLLSPGKLVRQADMQLMDMVSMGYQKSETQTQCLWPYQVTAHWKANEKAFEQLNYESQKTYITVAVDLVIKGIQEPVRFVIESPVTIQSQSEIRIMDHFISKRAMSLRFYLQLKKTDDDNWEVSSIDPSEEIVDPPNQFSLIGISFSKMVRSTSTVSIEDDFPTEDSSDGDEPLLSGTGEVSKDCSQDTLDEWDPILKEWDGEKRPKHLPALVRLGVPEALRGTIWQKLANVESKPDITDLYRTLITKETKCETVIQRDIHRTFPAHKRFKEMGGSGQDALFKVSKAYAVYDTEVGYCQGLSYIAASLLIHMPEEDAFCVLVSLMYDYGLRDLYKHGFETLYMRLNQLDRLIKEQLPKLHEHFEKSGVETHMFASQWFLTLFTARFPLYFVFHVLDVFLLDGVPILFQVALTLLSFCESELRQLDFEGILKYFRVTLPKKSRSSSQSKKLMKMACERKVKRLKQYEEEFILKKQIEEQQQAEARLYEEKFGEERKKLQSEIAEMQKTIAQMSEKAKQDEKKHTAIIQDYKHIIQRQEQQITKLNELLENFTKTVAKCQTCSTSISQSSPEHTQNIANKKDEQSLGPLDPLHVATQRVRELELELAQTKLAQVEAECKNQDLNHQLNTTLTELQSNRGSWQPWISKTINSIQEKVSTRRDIPTFQSYTNSAGHQQDTGNQDKQPLSLPHGSPKLRNKVPKYRPQARNSIDVIPTNDHPLLRDRLSLNSMK